MPLSSRTGTACSVVQTSLLRLGQLLVPQSCMCPKDTCRCIDSAGEKDRLISLYKPAPVPIYTAEVSILDDSPLPSPVDPDTSLRDSDYDQLFDTAEQTVKQTLTPEPGPVTATAAEFLVAAMARNRHRFVA